MVAHIVHIAPPSDKTLGLYPRMKGDAATKPARCLRTDCYRCDGSGVFSTLGMCFRCGGNGVDPTTKAWAFPSDWSDEQCAEFLVKTADYAAHRRELAQARKAKKAAVILDANVEANPALAAVISPSEAVAELLWGTPFFDMMETARKFPLSEKQVVFMVSLFEKASAADAVVATTVGSFFGEVGERLEFEGTVRVVMNTESDYGTQRFVILDTVDGGQLVLSGTSAWLWDVNEVGDVVTGKATVKAHNLKEYRKVTTRQSVMTRAVALKG